MSVETIRIPGNLFDAEAWLDVEIGANVTGLKVKINQTDAPSFGGLGGL
jgi:hypothetical protein